MTPVTPDETVPEATAGESAAPAALVASAGTVAGALPFTGLGLLEMLLGGLMAIALGAASLGLASRRS